MSGGLACAYMEKTACISAVRFLSDVQMGQC